ncbi:hypothetical protein, partial [Tannerella forsythia]|uniref:hypothetical protein n=1 Tax=Tannerella forsythia TaxID=28112 RepID=UPI001C54B1BD
KITQSMQVCLSKTSRPLNKSTFYIRFTALFAGGSILFPQRFATHEAELTHSRKGTSLKSGVNHDRKKKR